MTENIPFERPPAANKTRRDKPSEDIQKESGPNPARDKDQPNIPAATAREAEKKRELEKFDECPLCLCLTMHMEEHLAWHDYIDDPSVPPPSVPQPTQGKKL